LRIEIGAQFTLAQLVYRLELDGHNLESD
jgi:hypothetical protein